MCPFNKRVFQVKVPNRSGANLSHRNSGTLTCGTLTPLLVEEVIPNTRCSLKLNMVAQLPPLASDTYMNVKLKAEAFFVPFRLCCASFEDFFNDFPRTLATYASAGAHLSSLSQVRAAIPVFGFASDVPSTYYGAGSLLDYLGFKVDSISSGGTVSFNPLSLIAYHLIWQEFYRNPKVQNVCFAPDLGITDSSNNSDRLRIESLPFKYFHRQFTDSNSVTFPDNTSIGVTQSRLSSGIFNLADGVSIFDLRQRNFGFDYFTTSRPSAQQGNPSAVTMTIPSGANTTSFTIAQLRAANSLQQFRERNNIPSPRLVDQVKARYGANLADGIAQRPICIGSASYDVVSRGVDQTSEVGTSTSSNPFNSVAAQYGRAFGIGSDFIIEDFTANEPGLIMVMVSLVPEVTYSTGISPYLMRYLVDGSITDMACSLLQNVGDEPIDGLTLRGDSIAGGAPVFGYQDRYGTFMFHPNEVHGLMRDGQSLESFVLQRSFATWPTQGSQFLEIPKNYLDGVFAVSSQVSGLSAWYDAKLNWRVSLPLAEFSVPSLQDPAYEHGHSVNLIRNGQIF